MNSLKFAAVISVMPFALRAQPNPVTLNSIADTYLQSGQPNQGNGTSTFLRVQGSGSNRTIVRFDQTAISNAIGAGGLASAKLRLYIASNGNNWGSGGGTVGAHRMTVNWTEAGATWNCPNDTNTGNPSPDCSPQWHMDDYPNWPFQQAPAQVVVLANNQTGWVEWDVTADVAAFLAATATNYGWMVRKMDESLSGKADYSSREGSFPPQLVLTPGTPPPPPPPAPTIRSSADTYLLSGSANQNKGYDTILRVQDSGNNRALVQFSQAAIAAYVGTNSLSSAKLRLYIVDNGNNWGTSGRPVNLHRMTAAWTEAGATWNCPIDTNPSNSSKDCTPDWSMSQSAQWPFASTPTASVVHQNQQTGWAEWDVTADVSAFLAGTAQNFGWIVKKADETQAGQADYSSREGTFPPILVLTVPVSVSVSVAPPTASLFASQTQQFSSTVTGLSSTAVSWSISPPTGAGSINGSGLYTAPASIGAFQAVTITATSVADSTQSASSSVVLMPVSVSVSPSSTSLLNSQTQQFTANFTGTSNPAVTWSRSPNVGTITPAGVYTAPANMLTNQTITVTATSQADSAQLGTASINLVSGGQITSLTPASARAGEAVAIAIAGQGTNFSSGSTQVSVGSGITVGTVTVVSPTTLTATLTVDRAATQGARDVVATIGGVPISLPGGFNVAVPLPLVTIVTPAPQSFTNVSPATVRGTVSDPMAVVTVNGVAADNSGGNFLVTVPLVEGNNELVAVAQSSAGVGTTSVQITLDTTPPKVAVTSPPSGTTTTASSISVSGTINDIVVGTVNNQQATVTVNGNSAAVANRTFLAANVPLTLGANTISVAGTDRSGNSATTTITVARVAQTQPEIRMVSGANQSGVISSLLAAPLVVSLVDATGLPQAGKPVIFKVAQDNGSLNGGVGTVTQFQNGAITQSVIVNTDTQGQVRVNWTLGSRAGAGNNRVEATAGGFTGTAVFQASATTATPSQINVDAGGNQSGAVNSALAFPFVVVVTDVGHNRLANVQVTFTVTQGGGSLGGQASVTQNTDSDGRALVTLNLGPLSGIQNNTVSATFTGNTGAPAIFAASALTPGNPAQTQVSGVVLDNANTPIEGVTMRLYQPYMGQANNVPQQVGAAVQTGARGQFSLTGVPVGRFKLMADPSTTIRPGSWPTLEYDVVTVAGQNNTIGMPIYLLPLDTADQVCVTATTGGTLTLPQVPGFSLKLQPGSVTFPGGSLSGCVGVTPVHIDKVPMVPAFGQQPRIVVTIQPVGAVFNPPAAVTFPNVDGLRPREVTELFSFDHDLNSFVSIGTGTVSDDGQIVQSDAGIGVLKAGWHGPGPPPPSGRGQNAAVAIRANVIDQDQRTNTLFSELPFNGTAYGGSQPDTADNLQLEAIASPGDQVVSYSWAIAGPGAGSYLPPPVSLASQVWNVGDLQPTPGILQFTVVAQFSSGSTATATRDVEVGIRTDDFTSIGWINPQGVPLDPAGVHPNLLDYFPPSGNVPLARRAFSFIYLGSLSTGGSGTPSPPATSVPMTAADKRYLLNWLFKFAANPLGLPSSFASEAELDALEAPTQVLRTRYKLFNRLQVKYRVSGTQFGGPPLTVRSRVHVGTTIEPIFGIPVFGADGPKEAYLNWNTNTVYQINDGSPDSIAVGAFNTLMRPLLWSDIGSRVEFSISNGTQAQVFTQVYPTYYIYRNFNRVDIRPQAPEPAGNFSTNPYPPGPAPFIP